AVRERLGIEKGLELTLIPLDENRLLLEKVPRLSQLFKFMGRARGAALLLDDIASETQIDDERLSELFPSYRPFLKRFDFDAGPCLLHFTWEQASELPSKAVLQHERSRTEIILHP